MPIFWEKIDFKIFGQLTTMQHTQNNPSLAKSKTGLSDIDCAVLNPSTWLQEVLSIPREEGYIEVEGADVHYFRWGDKSKPSIVMLHGFLSHARCFAFIAPYLAADYHVVAYDFSGMGDSGTRETYPLTVRIEELLGVVEKTGLNDNNNKPTIISHSYGGHVGVAAVEQHPEKFAGIIICDLMILRPSVLAKKAELSKPPGHQSGKRQNRIYPDYETAKQRFVLSPPQQVEQSELFDFMAFHSLKEVEGGWTWKFDPGLFNNELGADKEFSKTPRKLIKASTRKAIIYGQESLLFTDDSADYMREIMAELDEADFPIIGIPLSRHHLMLDQPIALAVALKSVLAMWAAG